MPCEIFDRSRHANRFRGPVMPSKDAWATNSSDNRMEPGGDRHAGSALLGVVLAIWADPVFGLGLWFSCTLECSLASSVSLPCGIRAYPGDGWNLHAADAGARRQMLAAISDNASWHDPAC